MTATISTIDVMRHAKAETARIADLIRKLISHDPRARRSNAAEMQHASAHGMKRTTRFLVIHTPMSPLSEHQSVAIKNRLTPGVSVPSDLLR